MEDPLDKLVCVESLEWARGLRVIACEKGDRVPENGLIPLFSEEEIDDIVIGRFSAPLRECVNLAELCGDRVIEVRDAEDGLLFDGRERWKQTEIKWHLTGLPM